MPPKDGIMRRTPTGRAVGRNVVWHNFLCCLGTCYAFGQVCRDCHITENRECSMAFVTNRTSSILCLFLGIRGISHPPYTP